MAKTRRPKTRIGGNGFTAWPADHTVRHLAADMTPGALNIANNQMTKAIDALNSILNRLPEDSDTYRQLMEAGQAIYNLGGDICSAIEAQRGIYEFAS